GLGPPTMSKQEQRRRSSKRKRASAQPQEIDRRYSSTTRCVRSRGVVRCKIARFGKTKWQSCAIVPDSVTVNFREEVHYMKRSSVLFYLLVLCAAIGAAAAWVHAQGRGASPEAQARQKQQLELEEATP